MKRNDQDDFEPQSREEREEIFLSALRVFAVNIL